MTNERDMELWHLLRETENVWPVRDVGPVLGNLEKASTDNLAEVRSDGSGENLKGCVLVIEIRASSSSGANGVCVRERANH